MIPYRLINLLLFLGFSYSIFAQSYIGFKGGINQSKSIFFFNIDPVDVINTGDLNGFYFSIPAEFYLTDNFSLLPELALISDGTVLSVQTRENQRIYHNTIFYTKIPILGKYTIFQHQQYKFSLMGGVTPAYALAVKSYYYTTVNFNSTIDVPINFEEAGIRRFDLALSAGLNLEKIIAKGWKILLDIRYNSGTLDIESHSPLTNTSENVQLTFGLLAPLFQAKQKEKQ